MKHKEEHEKSEKKSEKGHTGYHEGAREGPFDHLRTAAATAARAWCMARSSPPEGGTATAAGGMEGGTTAGGTGEKDVEGILSKVTAKDE